MKYLFSIILSLSTVMSFAQSAADTFESARSAYENGDNTASIQYLNSCEQVLGRTNPRIESLRALSYAAQNDWINTSISLGKYFKMVPYSNGVAHKDLLALKGKADEQLTKLDQGYKEKLDKDRMQVADKYVSAVKSEITAAKQNLMQKKQDRLYKLYSASKNPALMKDFATYYPNTNSAKQLNSESDYLELVFAGNIAFKKGYYSTAVEKYQAAEAIYSPDTLIKKLNIALDEEAFQKADKATTIEGLEVYKAKYPYGIHINYANDVLQNSYLKIAREYIRQVDYPNGIKYYKILIEGYPAGKHVRIANTEICDAYFNYAKATEKTDLATSANYFKEALNCNHSGVTESRIRRLERKIKRGSYPDEDYIAWNADKDNYIGLTMGRLNNSGAGFYWGGRTGSSFFDPTLSNWKTDDAGSNADAPDKSKIYTGQSKTRALFVNLGLTLKIARPFWIYAGPGVAFTSEIKQFKSKNSSVVDWAANKDKTSTSFAPEAGVQLLLGPITIRYGVNKCFGDKVYKDIVQTLGFGFTW